MTPLIVLVALMVSPAIALKQFGRGSSIQWVIDLESKYPRGIYCRKVEAYLTKADPKVGSTDTGSHTDFFFDPQLHFTVTSSSVFHPNLATASETEVEVGSRYKLSWVVNRILRGTFHLQLVCLHPGPYASTPSSVHGEMRSILALSEPFDLIDRRTGSSDRLTYLKDISPPDLYEESTFECPILQDRMTHPITDGMHTFDAKALHEHFQNLQAANGQLLCPYRHPLKKLAIDEQMIARSQKFSQDLVTDLFQNQLWCFADREARETDLKTQHIYKIPFDMGAVSFGPSKTQPDPKYELLIMGRLGQVMKDMRVSTTQMMFPLIKVLIHMMGLTIYANYALETNQDLELIREMYRQTHPIASRLFPVNEMTGLLHFGYLFALLVGTLFKAFNHACSFMDRFARVRLLRDALHHQPRQEGRRSHLRSGDDASNQSESRGGEGESSVGRNMRFQRELRRMVEQEQTRSMGMDDMLSRLRDYAHTPTEPWYN